jgi:hypothetical protein
MIRSALPALGLVKSLQLLVGIGCLGIMLVIGYFTDQVFLPGAQVALILDKVMLLTAVLGLAIGVLRKSM